MSAGIDIDNAMPLIENNTISGGPVIGSPTIILMDDSQPDIVNDILFSGSTVNSYCIYESDKNISSPTYIGNNDF
ncbi:MULTISPECIES: hypothetical protein [unclassified Oceanispirochaeta]|uniref:hypothetical protein n=1 Tax=unclassified Oceanispirochaeta TaxID=2635722 RepID=UPI000E09BFCE|nr:MULTISPECIES: hypothetical protein [unclassified Oceanispirochaeta]MBF9018806.1 hypothetical protein [Oceanispirochaeta sp. M2]NPD75275.1 hypothetical protein [Oceanispirochaeta sp. M1]RDG28866.1 hypothetical protein DV872_24590 [Oceanispirochaeta sp. M1]